MTIQEDEYISTYICKLCGKTVYDSFGKERIAKKSMLDYTALGDFNNPTSPMLSKYRIHDCENGSMGVALFVGFTRGPLDCDNHEGVQNGE